MEPAVNAARKTSESEFNAVSTKRAAQLRQADGNSVNYPSPALALRAMLEADLAPMSVEQPWPGYVRLTVIVGGSVLAWAAFAAVGLAIFR